MPVKKLDLKYFNKINMDENETQILKTKVEDDIFDFILKYMSKVENLSNVTARQKKKYVQQQIKNILGEESYERYNPFISVSIDFIVVLSKNKKMLDAINSNKNCFKIFCCKK